MGQKILVAFDDSENAMRAVEYVAENFTIENTLTLFSVIQDSAALCEMNSPELTDYFITQQATFCLLENEKKKLIEKAQLKAKSLLMSAGFPDKNITLKADPKRNGVARDIVNEAMEGYDLIVMGRRGLSGIKEFFLGSISHKVFSTAKNISILIVN